MRKLVLLSSLLGGALMLGWQVSIPQAVDKSAKSLAESGSMTATFGVTPSGGTNKEYKISYSKPNLFRIESPEGYTLSDGTDLFTYTKASNTYTQSPLGEGGVAKATSAAEVWGWMAFFAKEPFKGFTGVKVNGDRTIRGVSVTMADFTLAGGGSGTLFIDAKLGIVRGYMLKADDKDLLVMASDIKVSKDPADAAAFSFTAPEGAKKVEPAKASEASYASVQALFNRSCMPCHGAATRSGGIDLTNYEGAVRGVKAGDPDNSRIYKSVTATGVKRMPQGRPALNQAQLDLIKNWIADGAKAE